MPAQSSFQKKQQGANVVTLLLIAVLTAVASEFKLLPFSGELLRFGLGSIVFLLVILVRPPSSIIQAGVVTGITVVVFRVFVDQVLSIASVETSVSNHFSAAIFYIVFAIGLQLIKIQSFKDSPLLLGLWAALFEFIANAFEHLLRYVSLPHENIGLYDWLLLGGVALLRSFFVVGLYSSLAMAEQKKLVKEMLGIGSELYVETLYLQKSMNHIEQITALSHDLYRQLKKNGMTTLSKQALHITQEIHEVKKDSQRILSSLSKLTNQEQKDYFLLSDVLQFVVEANKKYSEFQQKNIAFHIVSTIDFKTNKHIALLALINNLVSNAVESIQLNGEITISMSGDETALMIIIQDSGEGIAEEALALIFEPGYTTKFNAAGVAATGIGLSHVQTIIRMLRGRITVQSQLSMTQFTIKLPLDQIRK